MGKGIGSFNDHIRDSVTGGSPFGLSLQQGFVTGLSLQANEHNHGEQDDVAMYLASITDWIHDWIGQERKGLCIHWLRGTRGKKIRNSNA